MSLRVLLYKIAWRHCCVKTHCRERRTNDDNRRLGWKILEVPKKITARVFADAFVYRDNRLSAARWSRIPESDVGLVAGHLVYAIRSGVCGPKV